MLVYGFLGGVILWKQEEEGVLDLNQIWILDLKRVCKVDDELRLRIDVTLGCKDGPALLWVRDWGLDWSMANEYASWLQQTRASIGRWGKKEGKNKKR